MLSLIRQPFVQGNRFQTYDSLPTFILFALLGAVDNTSNDGQLWNSGLVCSNFTVNRTIYAELSYMMKQ